jgi:hypothetical protein
MGMVVVLVLGNCLVVAQNFSGTISGVVRDASGAVIPQATVSVRNTETGQTRIAETGVNGSYTVPSLPVGPYELTVEKPGFRQLVRSGITLSVGQEAALNLTLEVGNVTQTVEVTGEAPLVNTTLSETSGLITEGQLKDMPLNGRSFHQLMLLNPNTVDNRSNSGAASFSVAGKRTENNRWTMNGVDYIGDNSTGQQIAPNGLSGQLLGIEAVREFNVLGPTYGAEYGKRSGGQVTAVTISGTNQLHGTVFEYLRNSALDARNFFDTEDRNGDGKIDATPLKRNQFGASLGGPIIRDKMFLYGNYEGYRQRRGESSDEFVPSAQARQGLLPCYIATPAACPASAGLAARNAYVPVPNLEPRQLPYAKLFYPEPNGGEVFRDGLATGIARATSNPVRRTEEDYGLARFDYNVSSADSVSANFSVDEGRDSDPEDNTLLRGADTRDLYLLSVQETHIFSPTILNVATFGTSTSGAVSNSVFTTQIPENLIFLKGENRTSPGAIVIGGGATAAQASSLVSPNPQNPYFNNREYYTASNDLSMTRGRHNLKMGVWFQRIRQNAFSSAQQNAGTANYPTVLAFLQDVQTSFGFQANPTELSFRSTQAAWYFQDEIKLRPNLTVRLGLRDESTTGWNEANGHSANYLYDPNGVIQLNPLIGRSPFVENHAIALWQPRVGVAWDPGGTGKWAVRAGFGIHNDLQDNLTHRLNSNPPFAARVTIENTPLHSLIPITSAGGAPASCRAGSPLVPPACSTFAPGGLDPVMHTPTIQEWSLTVEREITQDFAVQIGYVGSQSYHVSTSMDMNTIRPVRCENPAGCLSGGVLAASDRVTVPQGTEYVPWAPRVDAAGSFRGYQPRPNPYVNSTQTWMYLGTASSHGGHISLLKRARAGLTFKTNYTFSKAIDLDSAILSTSATNDPATILNPYNLKLNRGVASYSIAHVFNTNSSYELPFGSGKAFGGSATGWVDKVIGGWQWNGILTVQGGFPITPWLSVNRSGNGDSRLPDLPNYNPNFTGDIILGVDGIKKDGRYLDPNAFVQPLSGTFGNVSRGSFRGPGFFQVDTSFFKRVPLTERFNMQFRAEFFNLLNHVNFDTPSPVLFSGANYAGSAGVVNETIAGNERQIQFALRLEF